MHLTNFYNYKNYLYSKPVKGLQGCRVGYRFSFNGKETDTETQTQDYGMRIYDYRLGKFLSIDPLSKSYPWYTPYQFAGNNSIRFIDLDGGEPKDPPGMFLNNPNSKNYQDHYQNGGNLTRVYDISTVKKYWVHQQNAVNGGVSFYWYNEQALKWQPFTPNGYADNGNWQDGEYGIGNHKKFQEAIQNRQFMLNFAAGFACFSANFSVGGLSPSAGISGLGYERAAAVLGDVTVQLASNKSFNKDYNYTSTFANAILPNANILSATIGSFGEYTFKDGFTITGDKTGLEALKESSYGLLGNYGSGLISEYGINLPGSSTFAWKFGVSTLSESLGNAIPAAVGEINKVKQKQDENK